MHRLFTNASTNRNLDNLFLTRDTLNYCHAFSISNTALIHSAKADYQTSNLWVDIYNKIVQNAGLTGEEKSFLHCLRYMMHVESAYSQIVDKICYLLVWQTKQPSIIRGDNMNCCKRVDTVDTISTRCPLATKCEFLAGNGFGDLADACDVDLRNSVAHMTAIIGKPTIRTTYNSTAATREMRNKVSITGTDVRIKRRSQDGSYKWEKVNIEKVGRQLEIAVWRYNAAFSLCDTVNRFAIDPMFLCAMNNPGDPYTVTFSNGDINISYNAPDESNQ